ncbi:MAG: hypothetical protein IPP55_17975 [Anaerolineales bacterium]|nr:hypothetical protein [Anaerolineales bacterium]
MTKKNASQKNGLCKMKPLACQNLSKNHVANFGNLSKFDTKLLKQKPEPIFEEPKFRKLPTAKMPDFTEAKTLLKPKP